MRKIYTAFFINLLITVVYSQVPIQYYDFEDDADRTLGQINSEIIINGVSDNSLISVGGVLTNVSGNPSSGSAQQRGGWDGNGITDPGLSAVDYLQVLVNTDGFNGISVSVDAAASALLSGPAGNINILYSFNGGVDFSFSSPQQLTTAFTTYSWNLSGVSSLDNNSAVILRIYAYGDITGTGTLTVDNLTVSANEVISSRTLGNYQLIDNANGAAPFPSFTDFTVNGSGINVTLSSNLILNNMLTLNSGRIATESNEVKLTPSGSISSYNSNNYVNGNLTRYWSSLNDATLFFPVGSASSYHPAEITTGFINNGGSIKVSLTESAPGYTSLPAGINNISATRFWSITPGDGISFDNTNGLFGLKLFWGNDDGVTDVSNVSVVRGINNGAWFEESNTGTFGNSSSGWILGSFNNPSANDFTFGNKGSNVLPVELSLFTADVIRGNVKLSWRTESEKNNYGFEVERRQESVESSQESEVRRQKTEIGGWRSEDGGQRSEVGGQRSEVRGQDGIQNEGGNWVTIGFVKGAGNSNSSKEYSIIDKPVSGVEFSYRLKQIDNDGSFRYSKVLDVTIGNPAEFRLEQNYPNPFNPSTQIEYSLAEDGLVTLDLYNLLGEKLNTLVNEVKPAGNYIYKFNANGLSSGIYFYKITLRNFTRVKKMILLR